ncbi:MAG: deoxynucleoside kinase, partial [Bacteroidales bacterium]|nr:deoxynucleoside kinase [Bacteroidales bacterium]
NPARYSFTLELSFLADRYQQLKEELGTLDIFSPFTVADYFFVKSLVFASSTLDGDEYKLYRQIFYIIYNTLPKPDLFVFLHVSPDNLLKNIEKRGREYESSITKEYLKNIQESYFTYFRQNPENRYLILNTDDIDFVNSKSDYKKVLGAIFDSEHPIGLNRLFF